MTDHSEKPPRHIGCDDHDACEGGPCKQAEQPWDPSMKLRSSATDEQIVKRYQKIPVAMVSTASPDSSLGPVSLLSLKEQEKWAGVIGVARELASTVSAERDEKIEILSSYIAEQEYSVAEKDAEIARLRIDAERLDKLDAMREAE